MTKRELSKIIESSYDHFNNVQIDKNSNVTAIYIPKHNRVKKQRIFIGMDTDILQELVDSGIITKENANSYEYLLKKIY